jgi:hypothetical protein
MLGQGLLFPWNDITFIKILSDGDGAINWHM